MKLYNSIHFGTFYEPIESKVILMPYFNSQELIKVHENGYSNFNDNILNDITISDGNIILDYTSSTIDEFVLKISEFSSDNFSDNEFVNTYNDSGTIILDYTVG